jgi:hypothetical protein
MLPFYLSCRLLRLNGAQPKRVGDAPGQGFPPVDPGRTVDGAIIHRERTS